MCSIQNAGECCSEATCDTDCLMQGAYFSVTSPVRILFFLWSVHGRNDCFTCYRKSRLTGQRDNDQNCPPPPAQIIYHPNTVLQMCPTFTCVLASSYTVLLNFQLNANCSDILSIEKINSDLTLRSQDKYFLIPTYRNNYEDLKGVKILMKFQVISHIRYIIPDNKFR